MSLQRASQYLSNQKIFKGLNAFVHVPQDVAKLRRAAQEADARLSHGRLEQGSSVHSSLIAAG